MQNSCKQDCSKDSVDVNIPCLYQVMTVFFFLLIAVYSNTKFLVEESFLDRVNALDVDLSLELSLMGGLVEVSGLSLNKYCY